MTEPSHSCEYDGLPLVSDPRVSDDVDLENDTLFKELFTLPRTPPTSFNPRNCFFFLLDLPGSDIVEQEKETISWVETCGGSSW